mgnify:FL=1
MFLLAKPYLTFHKDTQFAMNMSVLLHIFLIVTNVNLDLFHLLKSDIHVYMLIPIVSLRDVAWNVVRQVVCEQSCHQRLTF